MNKQHTSPQESISMRKITHSMVRVATSWQDKTQTAWGQLIKTALLLCIGTSLHTASWAQTFLEEPSVRARLRVDRTINALTSSTPSPQSVPYNQSPAPVPVAVPQQQVYYPMTVYVLAPPGAGPMQSPPLAAPVPVAQPVQFAAPAQIPVPAQVVAPPVQVVPPPVQVAMPAPVSPPTQVLPQPVQTPAAQEQWQVQLTDQTMSILLRRWAAQAGWQLVWEADRDYPIDSNFTLQGDFLTVLESVMRSVQRSDYPLQAVANTRTRVLRIVRYLDGQRN